jgi:hypothetical protein
MSLYGILGVLPEAKDIEIRRAYRKLALRSDGCCATYRKLCDIPVLVSFLSNNSDARKIQPDSPRHCYSFQLLAPSVERITARSGEADGTGTPLTSGYTKHTVAFARFQTAPR